MLNKLEIKKKHHYVWAYYLKAWSNNSRDIWYIKKKGGVAFDSVRSLGYENGFYNVGVLNEQDVYILGQWIKLANPTLQVLYYDLLEKVLLMQKNNEDFLQKSQELASNNVKEWLESNAFENILSLHENNAVAIIQKLRAGDVSCLNNKSDFMEFSIFLGIQWSRTKRMKEALLNGAKLPISNSAVQDLVIQCHKKHWWFMCYFFGVNLSLDIALNKNKKIHLIENNTSEWFITSDQPVVNINPDGQNGTEIDYYYPISFDKALLIINSGNFYMDFNNINAEGVEFLNKKIACFAGGGLYSKNKESLIKYESLYNKREFGV